MKVFYTENMYSPASIAEHDLMLCKYRLYASVAGRVSCRNRPAQRCYEETI